jgi:hypothetical protein
MKINFHKLEKIYSINVYSSNVGRHLNLLIFSCYVHSYTIYRHFCL